MTEKPGSVTGGDAGGDEKAALVGGVTTRGDDGDDGDDGVTTFLGARR